MLHYFFGIHINSLSYFDYKLANTFNLYKIKIICFNVNKYSILIMKCFLKISISSGLSLLLISSLLHADVYHNHENNHGICNIDCLEEKHHSNSHTYEKCFNDEEKWIKKNLSSLLIDKSDLSLSISNKSFKYSLSHFSLLSRPPPKSLLI